MINPYIENQKAYINKKKEQPLLGFTTPQNEQAVWGDIAMKLTGSGGREITIYLCNNNRKHPKFGTTFNEEDRLSPELYDLLFSYTLDTLKENVGKKNKETKLSQARRFLSALSQNIASASIEDIQEAIDSLKRPKSLTSLFHWLREHKMIAKSCQPIINTTSNGDYGRQVGDDALETENKKLPSEKALLAMGAIFHDVIPPYDGKGNKAWQSKPTSNQNLKDSFTCTMVALGMASPNRIAAEQVLLTPQQIQTHTEVVKGEEETVHYLVWRGSKGYKDNHNHINAEMVESLDRALHYTILATESTRALARFYRNPQRPLKEVLGTFTPSEENTALLSPNLNKPTSLLHLGLLLGFFDGSDKYVRVAPNTKGAIKLKKNKYIKPIAELTNFDTLVFKAFCPYAEFLTGRGITSQRQLISINGGLKELTVAEFQNFTVERNQPQLKGFNSTNEKFVDFENALFAYTEKQLSGHAKGAFQSRFDLVPIKNLSSRFTQELSKTKKNTTIFERYGFASDFNLKPHQLRHWQNDALAKKGLPHYLITMLSGRKSQEQTLRYIHTTDAQNAAVIGDISFKQNARSEDETKDEINLRLITNEQYQEALGDNSPTFVTAVGICTQDLSSTPCTYMTEFETQCTLCSSSCHITHDDKAIDLLTKDLKLQTDNLEKVKEAINFTTSESMQKWYKTHYRNTCMLKSLIEVLSDEKKEKGLMVRFLTRSNEMRITNLNTKTVESKKLQLPDAEQALQAALEAKPSQTDSGNDNFLDFLESF